MITGKNLIEVRGLKKYFKVSGRLLHAVDDVNLTIHENETLGVVGESGCGKSTLGRTILRLIEPTSGDILYKGKSILSLAPHELRRMRMHMQIIFQDPFSSLNPRLSIKEIISEPLIINRLYTDKKELSEKVYHYMDIVGLARRYANSYPHELDGGRRQRIGIARALAVQPKFIVCDEPVSALDVSIQAQILNLLQDLQEDIGLTYMFITHDLSVVKHISNKIAVMYLGQVVEIADTDELFNSPRHPYTKALLSAIPVPDYEAAQQPIDIIRGEVTSPIDPKPGCRFAVRCPLACDKCRTADPQLTNIGGDHQVACCQLKL